MGRHRGSGKGEELQHQQRQEQQTDGDDAGQMVVGTGVTMDYSVIEDRTLNASDYMHAVCHSFHHLL